MIHYTQTLAGELLENRWVTCNGQLVRKDGEGYGYGGGEEGGGDTRSCSYSTRFAFLESVQFQLSPTFPGIFKPVQLSSYHITQSLTATGG